MLQILILLIIGTMVMILIIIMIVIIIIIIMVIMIRLGTCPSQSVQVAIASKYVLFSQVHNKTVRVQHQPR